MEHMKHRRPLLRLQPGIELVPRSDEFVPGAVSGSRPGKMSLGRARGFVPAGNGIVPQITQFQEH
jgi:hypothetical protein